MTRFRHRTANFLRRCSRLRAHAGARIRMRADLPLRRFSRAARAAVKERFQKPTRAGAALQAAEREEVSGSVFGSVDLAHAGQRERAGAGQFDPQFQRTASSFHEPAQGGEIEVGLALDLDDGGLLDA